MIPRGARLGLACALALLSACGDPAPRPHRDTGLDALSLTRVAPALIVPGTRVTLTGQSFVDLTLGSSQLRLTGTLNRAPIDLAIAARFRSGSELELLVDEVIAAAIADAAGGELSGRFEGEARVEVDSVIDGRLHASAPLDLSLAFAPDLVPRLDDVGDGPSFVNQPIEVRGQGFLLGETEGQTRAVLSGCFTATGGTACEPLPVYELPAAPSRPFDRTAVSFPYASTVSGIGPGTFEGTVSVVNVHGSGTLRRSGSRPVRFEIQLPTIFSASTTAASLGQYVLVQGGGFVGGIDEATLLELKGTFAPSSGAPTRPIDLMLVPQWVSGPLVRYVLDETDPLGQLIDLRRSSGRITGAVRPIVAKGAQQVAGAPVPVALDILPVKQVVHVDFQASYLASLRKFGLRAIDPLLRARILAVAARDYDGVNIEFRPASPEDFAVYAKVDVVGPDPNGLGLLGYDNSPGKDVDNKRLFDHIGGVNATTQQDGYPGFGGIFTDSYFGFSQHPGGFAQSMPQATALFDRVFDPFRPDRGGLEVTGAELAELAVPVYTNGDRCPAPGSDRAQQIACAVVVLGNLIGSTMTHEVGHSLGLANPYGEGFHNYGDARNRLMDAGGDRPYTERAEMEGDGPAVFCQDEFEYLQRILPSGASDPLPERPSCD